MDTRLGYRVFAEEMFPMPDPVCLGGIQGFPQVSGMRLGALCARLLSLVYNEGSVMILELYETRRVKTRSLNQPFADHRGSDGTPGTLAQEPGAMGQVQVLATGLSYFSPEPHKTLFLKYRSFRAREPFGT